MVAAVVVRWPLEAAPDPLLGGVRAHNLFVGWGERMLDIARLWRVRAELWRGPMAAPPHDYVVHRASLIREQAIPDWRGLGTPPFKGAWFFPTTAIPAASSVTASNLFPHPPAPLSGSLEVGGVRARARESPGQCLARLPRKSPPRCVVPGDAPALFRASPACRLRHPPR